MGMTRRKFLSSTVAASAALGVASCADIQNLAPGIIDAIQAAVNAYAQYIPTVESIVSLAASLFGPQWVAVVQVGSTAFNQLIQYLEQLITQNPPAAARKLARMAANPGMRVLIGTVNGVSIYGYR